MKIVLTKEESEKYFYSALCNGHSLTYAGVKISYCNNEYSRAKKQWIKNNPDCEPCLEDVWMQMLKMNYKLTLIDVEGDEKPASITLKDVHDRVQDAPLKHLTDMIEGADDAVTAEVILQQVFLNDIVYG